MKTKFTNLFFVSMLAFLCSSIHVNGQANWMQTSTPPNGPIWAIETIGDNIFIGTTNGGIYFSNDNGVSWIQRNGAFPTMQVYALAVSGTDIYAAGFGGKIYKSSDNGLNWTDITPSAISTGSVIRALAVNGSQVFAGTDAYAQIFVSPLSGVSSSSWSLFNTGLPNSNIRSLEIKGNTIYAGTYGYGVWTSPTNSANWTLTSSTMVANSDYIQALSVSGSTIFSGNISGLPVLYRSTDNGFNWVQVNTSIFNDKPVYTIKSKGNSVFVGTEGQGILLSTDNGISWSTYNQGFQDSLGNWSCNQINVRSIAFTNTHMFAGTDCGVWKRSIITSGENELTDNSSFVLYPNPNNGKFNIQFNRINNNTIEIFNLLGEKMYTTNFEQQLSEIDLSGSPKGIYFIKIYDGDKVQTEKFVLR